MIEKRSKYWLVAVLLCVLVASGALGQRFGETLDPATVYPDHQPGKDVELPPLKDLRLISQYGDTALLVYSRVIPSDRRALGSVQLYYRYTVGEATGRVVARRVSTGGFRGVALGSDGVVAIHNGYALLDGSGEALTRDNGFAAIQEQFKSDTRELMRRPIPTPHGLLYQEALREDGRYKPGAIYYAPRDGLDYLVDGSVWKTFMS